MPSFLYRSPWKLWHPRVTWYARPQCERGILAGETQSDRPEAHVSCRHDQTVGWLQSAVPGGTRKSSQPRPGYVRSTVSLIFNREADNTQKHETIVNYLCVFLSNSCVRSFQDSSVRTSGKHSHSKFSLTL